MFHLENAQSKHLSTPGVLLYFHFFILNHSVQSGFGNDFDLKNPPQCTMKLLVGGETWEPDSFICLDQAFSSPWPGFPVFPCNILTKAIKWPLHSEERQGRWIHALHLTQVNHTPNSGISVKCLKLVVTAYCTWSLLLSRLKQDVLQRSKRCSHFTCGNIRARRESPAWLCLQTTSSHSPHLLSAETAALDTQTGTSLMLP